MGEDVAGCVAGSVVVVGEGTAGESEALGALSTGLSSKGTVCHQIRWFSSISWIYLFGSHVNCFLLLLLLFAFRSSNGESTEGSSQALQGIIPQPT